MLELLGSPQQLLNVLGDLLRLQDDILRAGKPGVKVAIQAFQLRVEVLFLAQLQKPLPFQAGVRQGGSILAMRPLADTLQTLGATIPLSPRCLTPAAGPHFACSHSHCLHRCRGGRACSGGHRARAAGQGCARGPPSPRQHTSRSARPSRGPWGCSLPCGGLLPGSTAAVGRRE